MRWLLEVRTLERIWKVQGQNRNMWMGEIFSKGRRERQAGEKTSVPLRILFSRRSVWRNRNFCEDSITSMVSNNLVSCPRQTLVVRQGRWIGPRWNCRKDTEKFAPSENPMPFTHRRNGIVFSSLPPDMESETDESSILVAIVDFSKACCCTMVLSVFPSIFVGSFSLSMFLFSHSQWRKTKERESMASLVAIHHEAIRVREATTKDTLLFNRQWKTTGQQERHGADTRRKR